MFILCYFICNFLNFVRVHSYKIAFFRKFELWTFLKIVMKLLVIMGNFEVMQNTFLYYNISVNL